MAFWQIKGLLLLAAALVATALAAGASGSTPRLAPPVADRACAKEAAARAPAAAIVVPNPSVRWHGG